jgi:heme-degrading monooxygenase HmoA
MYIIIWEYQIMAERAGEFERMYSATGEWAKLFRKSRGYLGTELLSHAREPQHYITIDRWSSPQEYESFLLEWKNEYQLLDAQCAGLTERETLLGKWESIPFETR